MSHVDSGPLAAYNSLQDKHLVGYFNNTRMRRHLRRSGLVTRNGEIVTENTFRLNMARKEHQKHVRDLMAQAIVHKALDMERHRQTEIKRKLEEISKVEMVQRVRSTRGRKGDEDITPYLSPRAPPGRPKSAKQERPQSVVSGHRPSTAPSKHSGATKKKSAIYVDKEGFPVHRDQAWAASDDGSDEIDSQNLRELDPYVLNNITLNMSPEEKQSTSPYKVDLTLPDPSPPPRTPRAPQGSKKSPRGTSRTVITRDGRRIRPKSNKGSLSLHRKEPAYPHPTQQQTLCDVTVRYRGNNLKIQYERQDTRDEIIINQQHCGGENLVVFHGLVEPGTDLVFTSRRHRGYPFSLTFFIDQIQVLRLSACCEYKYGPGVMLGGRKGHFKFGRVDGGSPCYRCMVEAELARRERQRYKDTQTEEPKPEPEPEPILESQGTQSDPPPPETREQAEQAEAGDEEAEVYDDDDFEDEEDKETAGSEKGDAPKAEDKSSDHFFSGPESDTEQKQPDDADYGADSDFEADSNHEKQDEEKTDKKIKEEEKEVGEEIPEEGEARDKNIQDEVPDEQPIKDEAQEAEDGVNDGVKVEEKQEDHTSVPEELAPQTVDEKDERQSSKHDDSDSGSDSEGDNRVLSSSSSSSSSSEDEDDQKTTRNATEAIASSSDSSSEDEAKDHEKQEMNKIEEPTAKEMKDEVKEVNVEKELYDKNSEGQSKDGDAKEEDKRSPSQPATEERDIPSTANSEHQEEVAEKDMQDEEKKEEDKRKEEEEEEEKAFVGKLIDKVKDVFTSSDSSSSESDRDDDEEKRKRKRKKKRKAKSKSGSESDEENKSKNTESDSDKDGKKSFFEKLKDKFTSSDSDSDDEKNKKKKEKSDSENTDVAEKDTSSKDPEQDDGEEANEDVGDKDEADEPSQGEGSTQNDEEENQKFSRDEEQEEKHDEEEKEEDKSSLEKSEGKVMFGESDSDSDSEGKDDKTDGVNKYKLATPPPKEEKEEETSWLEKLDGKIGDMFGGSDSDYDNDKKEVKEDIIKAEVGAETGTVPVKQEMEEEPRSSGLQDDDSQMQSNKAGEEEDDKTPEEEATTPPKEEQEEEKSWLEKLEGKIGGMFGGSDSDSENDKDKTEEKEDVIKAEEATTPPKEEQEEEKSWLEKLEGKIGDMFGGSDSDSENDKDKTEEKEDVIKAEEEAETGADPTTQESGSSELQYDSQTQSEREHGEEKDEKDEAASHGKDSAQEDNEDDGTQNTDDATKSDEDREKEDGEEEKKGKNKEDDFKEQETGVSYEEMGAAQHEEVKIKQDEPKDEDDRNKETRGDDDSVKEKRKDDGSITSRSSVSDSGSVAEGLDKDYKVLNLNDKNLDETKASKLARVLKQRKYCNLEYLLLRGNPLTDAGVATIIRSLIEKYTAATSADSALKLTHFDLSNSGMGDEAATELSKLLKLDTQLRNLNISENLLSSAAWEAVIGGLKVNRVLVTFSAEYAHLSDTSCVMLTDGIADHDRLEELNIEGNGLGERAGNALAQLVKDNSVITTINLEKDNSISPNILTEVKEILETGSYVP